MADRKEQARRTKQLILDTAAKMMDERGYDNVAVDDVVDACGVAKGTFYHYFKSKEDLLIYFTRTPYEYLEQCVEKDKGLPFARRLRSFISEWFEVMDKFNLYFARQSCMINREDSGEYGGEISHIVVGKKLIQGILSDGVACGELSPTFPVEDMSREIIFSMYGSTMYHCISPDSFDVPAWAETFSRIVFDSLLGPYLLSE
jgi:AcrR family transcriptional regulator